MWHVAAPSTSSLFIIYGISFDIAVASTVKMRKMRNIAAVRVGFFIANKCKKFAELASRLHMQQICGHAARHVAVAATLNACHFPLANCPPVHLLLLHVPTDPHPVSSISLHFIAAISTLFAQIEFYVITISNCLLRKLSLSFFIWLYLSLSLYISLSLPHPSAASLETALAGPRINPPC